MVCPLAFTLTPPTKEGSDTVRYFWPSYYISRFNFVAAHLFTTFYWFPFLLNNPLAFPFVNTLDAKNPLPAAQCTPLDYGALQSNVLLWFFVWWVPHSGLSRRVVKQALGLWGHPLDRPLFGVFACLGLTAFTHFWRPITDCADTKLNVFALSPLALLSSFGVIAFCMFLILGFFWTMPDHVFGTARHRVVQAPQKHTIFTSFPYGMVRHPAATGFLWLFWAVPSFNANKLLYAALWTIFIVIGTSFEEGGLRSQGEFGVEYSKYASQVGMFFPKLRWFQGKSVKLSQE